MTDALTTKTQKFVERLHAKTSKGELEWHQGFGGESFQTNVAGLTVQIYSHTEEDGPTTIGIIVRDKLGNLVDRFDDELLARLMPKTKGFSSYFKLMGDLYVQAQRQSLGAGKALDSMIDALKDDDDF